MAPGVWLFGWPTREAHATQITSPVAALKACAKPLPQTHQPFATS